MEGALRASRRTALFRLDIEVVAGIVTLRGRVRSLAQSLAAEDVAASVRGVLGVVNEVEVDRAGLSDETIEGDLRRRFRDIPAIEAAGIEAEVSEGRAVLIGRLPDARLRLRARDAAAEVEGVVAVEDRLETPSSTDEAILAALRGLLAPGSLARVAGKIRPTVEQGVVRLEGRVPSLAHRRQAEQLAWGVNGVRAVVNELEVVPRGVRFR